MVKLYRKRYRGPPLGGPIMRALIYCFDAHDGLCTTAQQYSWVYPDRVPTWSQRYSLRRARKTIGGLKLRRGLWRLPDTPDATPDER
jgi:hypothetical protein